MTLTLLLLPDMAGQLGKGRLLGTAEPAQWVFQSHGLLCLC